MGDSKFQKHHTDPKPRKERPGTSNDDVGYLWGDAGKRAAAAAVRRRKPKGYLWKGQK